MDTNTKPVQKIAVDEFRFPTAAIVVIAIGGYLLIFLIVLIIWNIFLSKDNDICQSWFAEDCMCGYSCEDIEPCSLSWFSEDCMCGYSCEDIEPCSLSWFAEDCMRGYSCDDIEPCSLSWFAEDCMRGYSCDDIEPCSLSWFAEDCMCECSCEDINPCKCISVECNISYPSKKKCMNAVCPSKEACDKCFCCCFSQEPEGRFSFCGSDENCYLCRSSGKSCIRLCCNCIDCSVWKQSCDRCKCFSQPETFECCCVKSRLDCVSKGAANDDIDDGGVNNQGNIDQQMEYMEQGIQQQQPQSGYHQQQSQSSSSSSQFSDLEETRSDLFTSQSSLEQTSSHLFGHSLMGKRYSPFGSGESRPDIFGQKQKDYTPNLKETGPFLSEKIKSDWLLPDLTEDDEEIRLDCLSQAAENDGVNNGGYNNQGYIDQQPEYMQQGIQQQQPQSVYHQQQSQYGKRNQQYEGRKLYQSSSSQFKVLKQTSSDQFTSQSSQQNSSHLSRDIFGHKQKDKTPNLEEIGPFSSEKISSNWLLPDLTEDGEGN